MKGLFKSLVCTALIAFSSAVYAGERVVESIGGVDTGVISDGITIGGKYAKESLIFNDYDFGTSTAAYNADGESAVTSGWIDVTKCNDDIIWHVDLSVLGSTGLDFTVEALLSDVTDAPITIHSKSFSAADRNYRLPLAEGALKWIRAKGQATGTDGTDTCTIKMRAEGDRK